MTRSTGKGRHAQDSTMSVPILWRRVVRSSERGLHFLSGAYLAAALFFPFAFFLVRFLLRNPEAGFSTWGDEALLCLATGTLTSLALLVTNRLFERGTKEQGKDRRYELFYTGFGFVMVLFWFASAIPVLIGGYGVFFLVLPLWLGIHPITSTRG